MSRIVRRDVYFSQPGRGNTDDVVQAVVERCRETGIKTVVVASNYGDTALKLGEALKGRARVVSVSEYRYGEEVKEKLRDLGVAVIEDCPIPVHDRPEFRDTLYFFGQGLKVAVEVVAIAAEQKAVTPYEDVIGVGGTSRGADAAAVLRATPIQDFLSDDEGKRMEIREIIAMPLKK